MKEFEKAIIDGWTITPPEDAQKARRWIQVIEALPDHRELSGGARRSADKTDNRENLEF